MTSVTVSVDHQLDRIWSLLGDGPLGMTGRIAWSCSLRWEDTLSLSDPFPGWYPGLINTQRGLSRSVYSPLSCVYSPFSWLVPTELPAPCGLDFPAMMDHKLPSSEHFIVRTKKPRCSLTSCGSEKLYHRGLVFLPEEKQANTENIHTTNRAGEELG